MDLANSHKFVDGQLVSTKVSQVVQAIKDYEPLIDVVWIPPTARVEGEAAFKIIYRDPNGPDFTLFHVKDETDFDERVLWRIIHNDQRNGDASLSEYEAWEAAQKAVQRQKQLDALEEANDIAAHVFRSHLNTYKVSDDLVIKEGIPFNAKNLKG